MTSCHSTNVNICSYLKSSHYNNHGHPLSYSLILWTSLYKIEGLQLINDSVAQQQQKNQLGTILMIEWKYFWSENASDSLRPASKMYVLAILCVNLFGF